TSRDEAKESGLKWFPYNKGGAFRKWYGNNERLVNWENDGFELWNFKPAVIRNPTCYFKNGITWAKVSSGKINARIFKKGFVFDSGAIAAFLENGKTLIELQSYLNCVLANEGLKFLTPTLNFTIKEIKQLPYKPITNPTTKQTIEETAQALISLSKSDWDAYERSWDFKRHPLLTQDVQTNLLETSYKKLRQNWQAMTDQMKELEEANNELFINHYGLSGELEKEVPLREISLTCNPHYRYPPNRSNPFDPKKAEKRLREDTVKELISYGVGCVFGRYSLDKDGLILVSQGETMDDYFKQIPQPSFMLDEDNAVPILEENWFADDLYARLEEFLKVAFGAEHLRDNLAFIKKALGKDLQKYLLKDFIKDHVQTYNKHPIYWLFSSPKKYFNLLIYMHRYTSSTLSVVLKYLREFKDKVNAEIESYRNLSVNASDSAEKTRALKTLDKYSAIVRDLEEYENKTIFPLASERMDIDLDEGVAVNYAKFGDALYKIKGVNG
ncbi:MAG: BREX-1 system adenine-specific DNA-methyltransferase PglX, partial [Thermotogota bacterium]|nr:BREX-1 system adenine-specific DNA-methyltransferase PglX [Thermotogota bacterium]